MASASTNRRTLYLTRHDLSRLRDVIATADELANGSAPKGVAQLRALLASATIAPAEYLPANVVTLGSKVRIIDTEAGDRRELLVSLPGDCSENGHAISILDPLGSALLGRTAGDTFNYEASAGALGSILPSFHFSRLDAAEAVNGDGLHCGFCH